MSSFPFESPNSGRRWRFTWESLAHIPILRLYLFNLEIGDTSAVCRFLEGSLRLDRSLLLVSWRLDDEATFSNGRSFLSIPVPRVLIDPGCPVEVKAMGDHIEAKLILLLPVDHPVEAELWSAPGIEVNRSLSLSMGSDIEKFSSEGVNFFCKSCSTKLTRQPLRNFVEVPSMNWQEVADNWFGGCCSFGGVSEKLVSKYLETFDFKEGTCLLDRASAAVCEHDLEGTVLESATLDFTVKYSESNDTSAVSCDFVASRACPGTEAHVVDLSSNAYSNQLGLVGAQNDINMDCLKPNFNHFSLRNEKTFTDAIGERISKCDFYCCITEKAQTSGHADGRTESEASTYSAQQSLKVYGSGFMGRTGPVVGGIRLFKCYISTSTPAGAPDDTFKNYTLENIFSHLLIEGARDELSFRTMVCDLRTKFPMLQIVLLNSRAWCCSGFCYENTVTRELPAMHMQPVVKVLFSDRSTPTEANSMINKDWSGRTGTEEVYMMNREIEELRRSLKSSIAKLPHSCTSLQGMSLSFLGR
ncbi:uncharacterized protein LOC110033090 isoform X2 [Phalaenopsis equestris]|uniref:uncharacterized protein LOC110033090 isoform X2 n=1 Tax=Phalaenopsis equestris TaxID=78828 RepID=UPI0009E4941A|nr:uncharacterized protein LOC110033090 isoform X2 [Phalaenopsis equestris]